MTGDGVLARIEAERDDITRLLAGKVGADKFIRAAATVLRTTPALLKCQPSSVMASLLVAAQLGLTVGGPLPGAYLVPYGKECTLIVSVHGFRQLLYTAGALDVQTYIIRQGDDIAHESTPDGVRVNWRSADPLDDERPMVGALAEIRFPGGGIIQELMTRRQILARKPAQGGAVWQRWEVEMWRKTVLRSAAKSARLVDESLALAIEADQAIISGDLDARTIRHVETGTEPRVRSLNELEATPTDDAAADPDDTDYQAWIASQEPVS